MLAKVRRSNEGRCALAAWYPGLADLLSLGEYMPRSTAGLPVVLAWVLFMIGEGCTPPWAPDLGPGPCAIACVGEIVNTYPHDANAFTEGLILDSGKLYESTGLQGHSTLRQIQLSTGAIEAMLPLNALEFGEGLAAAGDRLVQLTWQDHRAYVYDKNSLKLLATWSYPTEGWGLTFDGARFLMSDGTSTLYFRSPDDFSELGRVQVHDQNGYVNNLNELEYIGGLVYANVWLTEMIVIIDPQSGAVRGKIGLNGLWPVENRTSGDDVLNGIAYDPATGNLLVTGKRWPEIFEIRLKEIN